MLIRQTEIARRRHRQAKRKKLRKQLAAATTDQQRHDIEGKIKKTLPKYTTGS
jgi:hypothetical protein